MFRFRQALPIRRPPHEVFELLTRFEDIPRFVPQVVSAQQTSEGAVAAGTTFVQVGRFLGRTVETPTLVTEAEPPYRFAYRADAGPVPYEARYDLTPSDGGTLLEADVAVRFYGAARALEPLVGRLVRRVYAGNLERLRDLLDPPPTVTPGRRVDNPILRDAATFLETSEETAGERTLVELQVAPRGGTTPHYHLTYSERFRGREGTLTVHVDRSRHELEAGDEAVAPTGSLHWFGNETTEPAVAHVEVRPGHPGFEKALCVGYALAADGRTLKNATPRNPLHLAVLLRWGEIRLPGVYTALEPVFGLLARVAHRRGVDRELARRYL